MCAKGSYGYDACVTWNLFEEWLGRVDHPLPTFTFLEGINTGPPFQHRGLHKRPNQIFKSNQAQAKPNAPSQLKPAHQARLNQSSSSQTKSNQLKLESAQAKPNQSSSNQITQFKLHQTTSMQIKSDRIKSDQIRATHTEEMTFHFQVLLFMPGGFPICLSWHSTRKGSNVPSS